MPGTLWLMFITDTIGGEVVLIKVRAKTAKSYTSLYSFL